MLIPRVRRWMVAICLLIVCINCVAMEEDALLRNEEEIVHHISDNSGGMDHPARHIGHQEEAQADTATNGEQRSAPKVQAAVPKARQHALAMRWSSVAFHILAPMSACLI